MSSEAALPPSLVPRLLRYAATGADPFAEPCELLWSSTARVEREFRWAVAGGLGPLIHRALREFGHRAPSAIAEQLLSADLTALIRHAVRVETALEVIDACARLNVPVTLLKGISVSEQLYPAEHLRPMADIDVLIPAAACKPVESELLSLGHCTLEHATQAGEHHGAPLYHAARHTIVELHTQLFTDDSPLRRHDRLFSLSEIERSSIRSTFHGRPVLRLNAEFQLAFMASSWFNDLAHQKAHPSFLPTLFDAVYLMSAFGAGLDWDGLLERLDNDLAKSSVHALLTYLPRYGVAPPPGAFMKRLAAVQRVDGPLQLRLIHGMLDRYLVGGRVWNLPLPPPVPGRYSVANQAQKRVLQPWRAAWARARPSTD